MHRHRATTAAVAAMLLLAISGADVRRAAACSCLQQDLPGHVADATMVFVGKPISVVKRPLDPAECGKPKPNRCRYTYTHEIRVEGVWKGDVPAVVTLDTGSGGGDCTLGNLGEARWLFMSRSGRSINACNGSQRATKEILDEMRKRFGAPRAPRQR